MNKKGFTLVELLAVIIILSIISLITIPVVVKNITKSKEKTFTIKMNSLIESSKLYYQKAMTHGNDFEEGIDGINKIVLNLSDKEDINKLSLKNGQFDKGFVTITEDGEISATAIDGKYCGQKLASSNVINMLDIRNDFQCYLLDSTNQNVNTTDVLAAIQDLTNKVNNLIESNEELVELNEELSARVSNSFLTSHPVGSIYVTTSSDENTVEKMEALYGGEWETYGAGRTLVGMGSNGTTDYTTINDTGGSESESYKPAGTNTKMAVTMNAVELTHTGGAVKSHTLKASELPKISASFKIRKTAGANVIFDPSGSFSVSNVTTSSYSQLELASGNTTTNEKVTLSFGGDGGHTHEFTPPAKHSFTPSAKSYTNPTFTGTTATISHMQPYITVYMYKRTK